MHAPFGGLCLARPHSLSPSLSLSPRITRCLNACSSARPPLTRRSNILFERATPAYALLERLFERALARASARASLHSKYSLRPEPRSRVTGPT